MIKYKKEGVLSMMTEKEKRMFDRNVKAINKEFENISEGLISEEHWDKEFAAIKALLRGCEEIALKLNEDEEED